MESALVNGTAGVKKKTLRGKRDKQKYVVCKIGSPHLIQKSHPDVEGACDMASGRRTPENF